MPRPRSVSEAERMLVCVRDHCGWTARQIFAAVAGLGAANDNSDRHFEASRALALTVCESIADHLLQEFIRETEGRDRIVRGLALAAVQEGAEEIGRSWPA